MAWHLRLWVLAAAAVACAAAHGETPHERGRRLLQEGRYDEALATAREILGSHPGDAEAHHHEGLALYGLGHFPAAKAAFLASAKTAPTPSALRSSALRNAAMAVTEAGREDQEGGRAPAARAAFEEALSIDPGYALARLRLGLVLVPTGEYEAGREALRAYLDGDGTTPEGRGRAREALGTMALDEGDLAGAAAQFERALREADLYEARWYLDQTRAALEKIRRTAAVERRLSFALGALLALYLIGGAFAFRVLRGRGWV